MKFRNPFRRKETRVHRKNPHLEVRSGFFSTGEGNYFEGWDTSSNSIDFYLRSDLPKVRARSRECVKRNPLGKRYLSLMKTNIVGAKGITVQAQSKIFRKGKLVLDSRANDAIEERFLDWAKNANNVDRLGRSTLTSFEHSAIANCVQDGEFVFRKHYGKSAGKYGFQLESIDPELLDTTKNELRANGSEIRLGVEYNKAGKRIAYWFKERNFNGDYRSGVSYRVQASHIIHGFIPEWPNQSRGVPWTHAGLEEAKHLNKFSEAVIVRARAAANIVIGLTSEQGDEYTGDEQDEADPNLTYENVEPGSVMNFGRHNVESIDPNFPDAAVKDFIKTQKLNISAAWGVSYQSLSNDLEGTSFSSGRVGVQEEREHYKTIQEWFITEFMRPIYEEWLVMAYMSGELTLQAGSQRLPLSRPVDDYLPATFIGRRWQWIDPAKDGQASQTAIGLNLKSRSQIMAENGDDFDTTIQRIADEKARMKELGVTDEDLSDNDSSKPEKDEVDETSN